MHFREARIAALDTLCGSPQKRGVLVSERTPKIGGAQRRGRADASVPPSGLDDRCATCDQLLAKILGEGAEANPNVACTSALDRGQYMGRIAQGGVRLCLVVVTQISAQCA